MTTIQKFIFLVSTLAVILTLAVGVSTISEKIEVAFGREWGVAYVIFMVFCFVLNMNYSNNRKSQ